MNGFKVSGRKTGVRTLVQCCLQCTEFLRGNETNSGLFSMSCFAPGTYQTWNLLMYVSSFRLERGLWIMDITGEV